MRFGERTRSGTSVSGWTKRPTAGVGYGVATGGTSSSITVSGQAYTLLTFSSDGNLVVSQAGVFDLLLIGGGGSSNTSNGAYGGGGGGGVLGISTTLTVYLAADTYAVDVGAGSGGGWGANGSRSSVAGFIVGGGGGGGGRGNNYCGDGNLNFQQRFPFRGANGGGSVLDALFASGTIGFAGGYGPAAINTGAGSGGGGGGAGGSGGNASGGTGGSGGNGINISGFTGAGSAYYAGAGAGGSPSGTAGLGGVAGGGGAGVNYGAGGSNGAGAAGAVFVRFKV